MVCYSESSTERDRQQLIEKLVGCGESVLPAKSGPWHWYSAAIPDFQKHKSITTCCLLMRAESLNQEKSKPAHEENIQK